VDQYAFEGWNMSAETGVTYHPLTPTRILDSRINTGFSGPLSPNAAKTFQVTGVGGVPAGATAVTGNLTVTATNGAGTGPASDPSAGVTPFAGATYHPLTPTRILDSRINTGFSGPLSTNVAKTFQVTGVGGVPSGATAVTGNLTATQQDAPGYFYLGPVAMNNPTSSTLNFSLADQANAVTVALGSGGTLSVTYVDPWPGHSAQAVFDVTGYFTPAS